MSQRPMQFYYYHKQATYISACISSDIIRVGAKWDEWKIGTTDTPEKYKIVYEADSVKEAKIAVEFLVQHRQLKIDCISDNGVLVYIVEAPI